MAVRANRYILIQFRVQQKADFQHVADLDPIGRQVGGLTGRLGLHRRGAGSVGTGEQAANAAAPAMTNPAERALRTARAGRPVSRRDTIGMACSLISCNLVGLVSEERDYESGSFIESKSKKDANLVKRSRK